jgi:hypothetical protein
MIAEGTRCGWKDDDVWNSASRLPAAYLCLQPGSQTKLDLSALDHPFISSMKVPREVRQDARKEK